MPVVRRYARREVDDDFVFVHVRFFLGSFYEMRRAPAYPPARTSAALERHGIICVSAGYLAKASILSVKEFMHPNPLQRSFA